MQCKLRDIQDCLKALQSQHGSCGGRFGLCGDLCGNVLKLVRMNDRKLGETVALQLRQREELEALVRDFGKDIRNIVRDLGSRIDKLEASMDNLVEQLESLSENFSECAAHVKTRPYPAWNACNS